MDVRTIGLKKRIWKIGRCRVFFFVGAPIIIFLFHGLRAHRAPIIFFETHIANKKVIDNLSTDFFLFFYLVANSWAYRTFLKAKFIGQPKKSGWCAHCFFYHVIFESLSCAYAFLVAHDPYIPYSQPSRLHCLPSGPVAFHTWISLDKNHTTNCGCGFSSL